MIQDQIKATHIDYNDLAAAAERFYEAVSSKSRLTISAYLNAIKEFLNYYKTNGQFLFTVEDVEKYLKYLSNTKKLKTNSIILYLTAMRKFLDFLKKSNMLEKNPAKRIKLQRDSSNNQVHFFSKKELDSLIDLNDRQSAQSLRELSVLALFVYCGLSESEISGLKKTDISKRGRYWYITVKDSRNGETHLKLPKEIAGLIREYISNRHDNSSDFLFLSQSNRTKSKPLTVRGISNLITVMLRSRFSNVYKSEKLKPYALRNSSAIYMAASGRTYLEIMARFKFKNKSSVDKFFNLIEEFNAESN